MEVHQVGARAGAAGLRLGVHRAAGAGEGEAAFVGRFRKRVDEVRKVGVISVVNVVPEHLGLSGVVSGGLLTQRKVLVFFLDCLRDVIFCLDAATPGVSAVTVRFLH